MKAVSKILAGTAAIAAVTVGAAAPAAAQYYPGTGGGGLGDVLVGAVLNSILRGGNPYGYNGYYGTNNYNLERAAVDQCARAAEQRLNARYGNNNGYGYGYNTAGIRVVQIDRVQRTRNGNMRVYGQAGTTAYQGNYGGYGGYGGGYGGYGGYNQPYGGGYGQAGAPQYTFNCKFERNGQVTDLNIGRNRYAYGY